MDKKLLSTIVGFVCVAITVICAFSVPNKAVWDIPVIEMIAELSGEGEDLNEMKKESREFVEMLEEEMDEATEEEIEEAEEELGIKMKKLVKIAKKPSINGIIFITSKMSDADIPFFDAFDEELVNVLKVIRGLLIGYGIFVAFFSLLGAWLKKKVFTILALIFSIPFYVFLVGIFPFVLFIIACIAHVKLVPKKQKKLS